MPSWTAHYDSHVPATLSPYPEKTLVDYLRENVAAAPSAPAVLFKGSVLSYGDLDRLSDRFAVALAGMGIQRGDRVALVLPNCPQFLITELGAWKAGATVLPLNPLYTGIELAEPLRASGAKVAVVLTPFYHRLKDVQAQTAVERIVATSIKEYLPPRLRILFTLFKERKGGHRIQLRPGDAWLQHGLRESNPHRTFPGTTTGPAPDEDAIMLLSGGTTGTPKAVPGKHRHLVAAGLQLKAWLNPPGDVRDIALLPLPLFHVYACVGAQSHALVSGTPLALVPNPRDLQDLLKTIEHVKPTLFSAEPAPFIALLNVPKVQPRRVDFISIRACFSG